jgi:hypothetical protein
MINKKATWEQDKDKKINDLSSDIITGCLRTKENTLSLWELSEETEVEIDKAILALSSNRDSVQRLDYIIVPDEYLVKYSLKVKNSPGRSPYKDFNDRHFDIINVNYYLLGQVSSMILDIMNNEGKIKRVHQQKIEDDLICAFNRGTLNKTAMSQKLLDNIKEITDMLAMV